MDTIISLERKDAELYALRHALEGKVDPKTLQKHGGPLGYARHIGACRAAFWEKTCYGR